MKLFALLVLIFVCGGALDADERDFLIELSSAMNMHWVDVNNCEDHQELICCDSDHVCGITFSNREGFIPESINSLLRLKELVFCNVNLTKSLPSTLSEITSLEGLQLSGVQQILENTFPSNIELSTSLKRIIILKSQLLGNVLSSLMRIKSLESLSIADNNISETFPSEFQDLVNLKDIHIDSEPITGSLPPLNKLQSLESIRILSTSIGGSLPNDIGSLSKLELLELSNNKFSGEIPETLGQLDNYVGLILSDNEFLGAIPESLGNLSTPFLRLGGNQLTGTIPASLSNMTGVLELDLKNNFLDGTVPNCLWKLEHIQIFDVSSNFLDAFPDDLYNLSANFMDFRDNCFTLCPKLTSSKTLSGSFEDNPFNDEQCDIPSKFSTNQKNNFEKCHQITHPYYHQMECNDSLCIIDSDLFIDVSIPFYYDTIFTENARIFVPATLKEVVFNNSGSGRFEIQGGTVIIDASLSSSFDGLINTVLRDPKFTFPLVANQYQEDDAGLHLQFKVDISSCIRTNTMHWWVICIIIVALLIFIATISMFCFLKKDRFKFHRLE